jgi:hypothetical protein
VTGSCEWYSWRVLVTDSRERKVVKEKSRKNSRERTVVKEQSWKNSRERTVVKEKSRKNSRERTVVKYHWLSELQNFDSIYRSFAVRSFVFVLANKLSHKLHAGDISRHRILCKGRCLLRGIYNVFQNSSVRENFLRGPRVVFGTQWVWLQKGLESDSQNLEGWGPICSRGTHTLNAWLLVIANPNWKGTVACKLVVKKVVNLYPKLFFVIAGAFLKKKTRKKVFFRVIRTPQKKLVWIFCSIDEPEDNVNVSDLLCIMIFKKGHLCDKGPKM